MDVMAGEYVIARLASKRVAPLQSTDQIDKMNDIAAMGAGIRFGANSNK